MKTKLQSTLSAIIALGVVASSALSVKAAEPTYEVPFEYKACTDDSFQRAVDDGITLGVSPTMPWTGIDPKTGKAIGIDVEMNAEVLKHMGITKIKYEVGAFNSLMPSMLSGRLDLVVQTIHVTPERLRTVAFTGPVWWYGPAMVVQAGNPKNIKSFADLNKVRVGVLLGEGTDEYLRKIGVPATRFQQVPELFAALQQDKVDVLLEYDLLAAEFTKANPNLKVESISNFDVPEDLLKNGYGYARFVLRKEDCSLRVAFNQALAEVRASGAMSAILKKRGLSDRNLFVFPLDLK